MTRLRSLLRNDSGAAVLEFALAIPVLVLFIWGIFQVGIAFQASAGMQNALGEGARLATLYPKRSNTEIVARINDKVFGTGIGTFAVTPVVDGPDYKDLKVSFTMTPNFLFFNGPRVTLVREKRVYTAQAPT